MRAEDRGVVLGLLIMMRRQGDGEDGHAGLQPGAHQPIDHGLRDEIMPVNAAIDHQRSGDDGVVSPCPREFQRHQGQFERAGNVDHVDLIQRDAFREPVERARHDVGVPIGFDEGEAGSGHGEVPIKKKSGGRTGGAAPQLQA